jgi:hypothetical protein
MNPEHSAATTEEDNLFEGNLFSWRRLRRSNHLNVLRFDDQEK